MLSQFSMFFFSVCYDTADSCCVSIHPFSFCYWLRHSHHCSSCSSNKKNPHRTLFTAKQNILPLCCHGCKTPLNASLSPSAPPSRCLGFQVCFAKSTKVLFGCWLGQQNAVIQSVFPHSTEIPQLFQMSSWWIAWSWPLTYIKHEINLVAAVLTWDFYYTDLFLQ